MMMQTTLNIRLANDGEVGAVTGLVNAAYTKWIDIIGVTPRPMLADYDALIQQGVVYGAWDGAELVGVLVIWQEDDSLYIDNIAVSPTQQKRGIGDTLLAFAEEKAREQNLAKMTLLTNEKMVSNQAYYIKHGYVETKREALASDRRVVFMHKPLL